MLMRILRILRRWVRVICRWWVKRRKGKARNEWECDFCGLECFCWGLTDGVADEEAVSL